MSDADQEEISAETSSATTEDTESQRSGDIAAETHQITATRDADLSFKENDHLSVAVKEEDRECNERSEPFPSTSLENVPQDNLDPTDESNAVSRSKDEQPTFVAVARALYTFNSINTMHLPFLKGDLMDIVDQKVDDPDWWVAVKPDGTHGLVPCVTLEIIRHADPVYPPRGKKITVEATEQFSTGEQSSGDDTFHKERLCYHKISRKVAEVVLASAAVGDYVVRESESKVSHWSVYCGNVI